VQKFKKLLLGVGAALLLAGVTSWVIADESVNITPHKKAYCRSIDNIESENNRSTHCVKVIDVVKTSDNAYRGIALMSDGSTYRFAAVWSDNFSYNLYYLNQEY